MISVNDRIRQMYRTPSMWAVTNDGFAMQLALLAELAGASQDDVRNLLLKITENLSLFNVLEEDAGRSMAVNCLKFLVKRKLIPVSSSDELLQDEL